LQSRVLMLKNIDKTGWGAHKENILFCSLLLKMYLKTILLYVSFVSFCGSASASAHLSASSSSSSASSSCFGDDIDAGAPKSSGLPVSGPFKRQRYEEKESDGTAKGARTSESDAMSSAVSTGEIYFKRAMDLIEKQQYESALGQLQLADRQEHVKAQVFLSKIYLEQSLYEKYDPNNGDNADQLTQHYLERAAQNGHMKYLELLWSTIMPDRSDRDGEIKWATRAARYGDENALARLESILEEESDTQAKGRVEYKLGRLYFEGKKIEKNLNRAFDLLSSAHIHKSTKATLFIKENPRVAEEMNTSK